MSIQAALESSTFQFYMALILGILVFAGLILLLMKFVLKKNVTSIWHTYRGWLIMIPLAMGAVFLGREATVVGITLLSIMGFKEFAKATGIYKDWWLTGGVYLTIVVIGILAIWPTSPEGHPGLFGLFRIIPVFGIAFLLLVPIIRDRTKGQLQWVSLSIVGYVYIGWMFGHLSFLADAANAYGYVLYLLLAVEVNDVAAFTFGKLFGKHKFRPNISPNKTWEGFFGALGVSLALPWLLGFSLPEFGALEKILTGLIIGIGGQMGDLSISVIKRDLDIKDMGAIIPGHGGILDRIDSLIYTAPLFLHMIHFFHGLW